MQLLFCTIRNEVDSGRSFSILFDALVTMLPISTSSIFPRRNESGTSGRARSLLYR